MVCLWRWRSSWFPGAAYLAAAVAWRRTGIGPAADNAAPPMAYSCMLSMAHTAQYTGEPFGTVRAATAHTLLCCLLYQRRQLLPLSPSACLPTAAPHTPRRTNVLRAPTPPPPPKPTSCFWLAVSSHYVLLHTPFICTTYSLLYISTLTLLASNSEGKLKSTSNFRAESSNCWRKLGINKNIHMQNMNHVHLLVKFKYFVRPQKFENIVHFV